MSEFLSKSLKHGFHFVILKPQNMISYEEIRNNPCRLRRI